MAFQIDYESQYMCYARAAFLEGRFSEEISVIRRNCSSEDCFPQQEPQNMKKETGKKQKTS